MTESHKSDNFPAAHHYTFRTERLRFRPLRLDDTDGIFALKSDPQVYHWTTPQQHPSEAQAWIRERLQSDEYLSFCVEELLIDDDAHDDVAAAKTEEKKPKIVGVCGGTHLPEIGYAFLPSVWGKGYATEAVKGFIKFYWDTFPNGYPSISDADEKKFLRAVTGPPDENRSAAASIKVLRKCGFEYWKEKLEEGSETMLQVWRCWGPGKKP